MKEVTAPVIATTLVMVAVFVPVATMAGITGRLYQQFAVTIVVSVLISSVNALSLSPALCSVLLRKPTPMGGPLGRFFGRFNRAFDRTTGKYMGFTQVVARKLTRSMLFVGVLVVGLVMLGGAIPGGFLPEEDQGYFYVNIQLPEAASLQRTDEVCAQVERILSEVPGIGFCRFTETDVVRHLLVKRIISAYERAERSAAEEQRNPDPEATNGPGGSGEEEDHS